MKLYHNPRCSKSRESLALLQKKKAPVEVVEYLAHPPTVPELRALLAALGMKAQDLVRTGEALYKEKFAGKSLTEAEWVAALAANPILIERPIFINGKKAVVGRPPERVLEIL
ncbi:MAG: arsenate reductase (glutaredoxin) [Spirochaetes bacterium]|nr:arsenate reductase (glutaredoxin) [Spirochaetota bacterium]